MELSEPLVRNIVEQVLAQVGDWAPTNGAGPTKHRFGVFTSPHDAVEAARVAFEQLSERTIEDRKHR